jgi:RHS repeat-associated protein
VAGTTVVGTTAYSFDGAGRLANLNHKNGSGTSLANYTYTFDNADRVSTETRNGTTTSYSYDDTNQVTGDGTRNYSYDDNGNRTMTGYATGVGNQLTNDGTWTYTYDNEGNLSEKTKAGGDTWDYAYDNRDRMTSATERSSPGGSLLTAATYVYDVYGNRIETDVWTQASGTVTVTRMAYDGQNAWADLDAGNALLTRRLYGDGVDQLLARITGGTGGTAGWYLTDHLGAVRNVTDGTGALAGTLSYDPFGNALTNTGSTDRYQFTAREFDSVTGLQYNRARYYDAATGRWTSTDPEGFGAGDTNLYRYVRNRPTTFRDPSGREGLALELEAEFTKGGMDAVLLCLAGLTGLTVGELAVIKTLPDAKRFLADWQAGHPTSQPQKVAPPVAQHPPMVQTPAHPFNLPTVVHTPADPPFQLPSMVHTPANPSFQQPMTVYTPAQAAAMVDTAQRALRFTNAGPLSSPFGDFSSPLTNVLDYLLHGLSGLLIASSAKTAAQADSLIEGGATSVTVNSRTDAEEVFRRRYLGAGYLNTTGRDPQDAKNLNGGTKNGTYHWDDKIGKDGRVEGHGPDNPHGELPHLQVHTFEGTTIRIDYIPK